MFHSLLSFVTPSIAYAADTTYVPLVLEGLAIEGGDLTGFINNLFDLAVLIASVIAVILITFYGLQYMTTEAVGKTKNAKTRIGQILTGILMLLGIWVFFNQINPDILSLRIALLNQPGGTVPRSGGNEQIQADSGNTAQNGTVTTFRGVGAQNLTTATLYRTNSESELRGVCGKAASGFVCGYTSVAQCQRALFTDSGCREHAGVSTATLREYVKICTKETAIGCTALLHIYAFFTIGVDPTDANKRIASFFTSRSQCVAAYGPECEQEKAVESQWRDLMETGRYTMHLHFTPKFLNGSTIEIIQSPDIDGQQTNPYAGQTGTVTRSFISTDGSVRYIIEVGDEEENFAEDSLQDPSVTP